MAGDLREVWGDLARLVRRGYVVLPDPNVRDLEVQHRMVRVSPQADPESVRRKAQQLCGVVRKHTH